jgi:integrase
MQEANMVQHEVSEGFLRQVGRNYYMRLVVDGQKKQKATGTNDLEKAVEMLADWRAQERVGVEAETRLRYESLRDDYIQKGGKTVPEAIVRDLDTFFRGLRIAAIDIGRLDQFREWRETQAQVLESKAETLEKEYEVRLLEASQGGKKNLTAAKKQEIRKLAEEWIENGVKATTDKRLSILRAMFHFARKRGTIKDVPHFPILGTKVDNKKRKFFNESQFKALLEKLPENLHPFTKFLYATGMRSGQAAKLTWDMVNEDKTALIVPGELIKNRTDFTLPLVYADGTTIKGFEFRDRNRQAGDPLFDTTDFRSQWRQACHALKLGIFNKETRSYRGMEPHDFRRTACRNMIAAGVPESIAMKISGHKTSSIFKRYTIEDQTLTQSAFGQMRGK